MKKSMGFLSIAILFFTGMNVFADEAIDENSLFGNDNIVSTNKLTDNSIQSNADKESLSITGRVRNDTSYFLSRKFITNWSTNAESNIFNTTMQGNLMVDVRLRQGIKAFANVEVDYLPFGQLVPHYYQQVSNGIPVGSMTLVDTNNTTLVLKEFFVDANFNKAVFLRAGKQVLQWGTAYFWNPSDLINIQRKSFTDMSAFREGSSGLKLTIPFGTVFNIYGYLNVTGITNIMDTGAAGKIEFLFGPSEVSLSAWAKRGYYPVYAMDFTSRFFNIDFRGEASLSYGDNNTKYFSNYIIPIGLTNITNNIFGQDYARWVPRISLGFTKTFDFLNISDRISLTGEVFWNDGGYYDPNVLKDDVRRAQIMNPLGGYYQPNYMSAYYAAVFLTYAEFFNPDLSFSYNMIMNLVDYSSIMVGSLSWSPVYNLTVTLNLEGFFGDANTEYTVSGGAVGFDLMTSLSF